MLKQANLSFSVTAQANGNDTNAIQFSTQDKKTAKLIFTIKEGKEALNLTDIDGEITLVMQDKSRFIDKVEVTKPLDGVLEYTLTQEQIRHAGRAQGEVKLIEKDGSSVGGLRFNFTIKKALMDEDLGPVKEFYINDLEAVKQKVQEKAGVINSEVQEKADTVSLEIQEKANAIEITRQDVQKKADAVKKEAQIRLEEVNTKATEVAGNLEQLDEKYQNKAYTVDEKLADVQATVNDLRENGTGIDAQARREVQQVSLQLDDTINDLRTREINVMYPPPPLVRAKGNQTNDDTTAIVGCINYLNNKGGVIRFPVGTFRFTSTIVVPDGVNLVGSGMRESHAGNTANRPTSLLKDGDFEGIELWSSASIINMCIDGNTGNGGIGVRFMGNKARLENVLVSKMGGDGIFIGHPTVEGNRNAWIMKNVASISNEGNGIVIDDYDPGYGPDVNAGLAERTNAWGNKGDGWVIGRSAVNTFLQCYGEENLGVGFRVKSTAMRNSFLNCGSERNGIEQFIFEAGSYNNLLLGSQEFIATDNGGNTVIRNTGGANQAFTVSRIIKSGKNENITSSIDGGLQMSGTTPGLIFNETDAVATEKTWDMIANGGLLQIRALDDDGKNPSTVVYFDRNGKDATLTRFNSIVGAMKGIGVGNSVTATTLGNVTRKMQVFDANGNSIGYVPIYNQIT